MTISPPPQPIPDPDSRGFWEATAQGRLALQHCASCGRHQFPALEACRYCGGPLAWQPVSGRGSIHTFIIQHHNVSPGFDARRPYPIALVCPDEAPELRLPAQIDCPDPSAVRVGARVMAHIVELPGGPYKIPVFRLET